MGGDPREVRSMLDSGSVALCSHSSRSAATTGSLPSREVVSATCCLSLKTNKKLLNLHEIHE